MTRIICFINRRLGTRIAEDLLTRPNLDLVAVVTNDPPHVDLDCDVLTSKVPVLCWSEYLTSFSSLPSDRGVSALFRHRVPVEVLATMPIINLHPSLLPWGRGSFPATWAIWESTPYGATAHLMTESIDEGPILAQRAVPVDAGDTSETLYQKGLDSLWDIYETELMSWLSGDPVTFRAQPTGGSQHTVVDFKGLKNLAQGRLTPDDRNRLMRALAVEATISRVISHWEE